MKTLITICLVIFLVDKATAQLNDSIAFFINGQEEWLFQQPDILSFRLNDKSQYTGSFDSTIVDKVDYFGTGDGIHNICFNKEASFMEKQSIYNQVDSLPNFEKFFVVPTKAEYVNETYHENYWMGTDMEINVIFDSTTTLTEAENFANDYSATVIYEPPSFIPLGVWVLEIVNERSDYYSPHISITVVKEMWENDSSKLFKADPSLRVFHPFTPNDSLYGDNWWMHGNGGDSCSGTLVNNEDPDIHFGGIIDPNAHIDLECAWNFNEEHHSGPSYSGKNIVVGVADWDGVQYSHPDCDSLFLSGVKLEHPNTL